MPRRYDLPTTIGYDSRHRTVRTPRVCCHLAMRLPLPGRSSAAADPADDDRPPHPSDSLEEGAATTTAPAPAADRGPKLQSATRKLAIASAQLLVIAAAVYAIGYVLGKLWVILLPIVL